MTTTDVAETGANGQGSDRLINKVLSECAVSEGSSVKARAIVTELWMIRPRSVHDRVPLPVIDSVARGAANSGEDLPSVVRCIFGLGRNLQEVALAEGLISGDEAKAIDYFTGEAVVRATIAFAHAEKERRDGWLSFFSHEIKNPLNTILNVVWLMRQGQPGPKELRFLELAEKALRKIEDRLKELRALHEHMRNEPPQKKILDQPRQE